MKIKPTKMVELAVRRNAKPINKVISIAEVTVNMGTLLIVTLKSVAGLHVWVYRIIRDTQRVGLYEFTDCKGTTFNVLLEDAQAMLAYDPDNHPARQFVLAELERCVADQAGSRFVVPHGLYLWGHPSRGFKRTEENGYKGFRRVRDANTAERKEYSGRLLRRAVSGLRNGYVEA